MSAHCTERAFVTSLTDSNITKGRVGTLRVGQIAALLGSPTCTTIRNARGRNRYKCI